MLATLYALRQDLGFAASDTAWLSGYDDVAKHPNAEWFTPDGEPWRCGAPTKAGKPCGRDVDRKGSRCPQHRERPPPHPGPAQHALAL